MCGIVGFVAADPTKLYTKRLDFLRQALFVDSLRGQGGTGIACVDKSGAITTHKRALCGPDFLNSLVWDYAARPIEGSRITIGHNRAATIGSIKDKNCHPFHYKDKQEIVLVHNGTLSSYYGLTPTNFQHDVDSAHAAYAMAQCEHEMDVLKKIKGPFVFVWYNKTKQTFNMARNSFRDIYYMMSKEGDIFYASEYMMLDWLMNRTGLELKWKVFKNPEQDTWLEWSFAEDGSIKKPVCRKIKYEEEARTSFRGPAETWDNRRNAWGYDTQRQESYPAWVNQKAELKQYGFEKDESCYVELLTFHKYQGSNYGKATAMLLFSEAKADKDEGWDVEILGLNTNDWDKWFKDHGNCFPVKIDGVKHIHKDGKEVGVELQARPDRTMLNAWEKEGVKDDATLAAAEMVIGPSGVYMPLTEWRIRTKQGCANCSNPIREKDFDQLRWIDDVEPPSVLCHICSQDKQLVMMLDPNHAKKAS